MALKEKELEARTGQAEVLLEGNGLHKTYRQGTRRIEVLRGIDLAVMPGEMVVIVGPSGSGKSTLLHLLGGLDRPCQGDVRFQGRDLYALPDRDRAQIRNRAFGFVFQFYHLVPELTALENVMLPGWIGGDPPKIVDGHARRLLEQVGLGDRSSHLPNELSGGEQQRVAIARALMNDPQLVFCDEPTGNLDSESGANILRLLVQFHREQKTAFLIVTHEPAVIRQGSLTDRRVLSLRDGQLWR